MQPEELQKLLDDSEFDYSTLRRWEIETLIPYLDAEKIRNLNHDEGMN